jgi:glycerophosphoryl diester phosphodiesterase
MTTRIWAHRGASSQAPENTLLAFDLAVRQQADGIELDVQRTADNVLVVAHDEDCRRVTGESGQIDQLAFAELRRRNFAALWPDAGFQAIPALAEVFDLIRPSGLTINIELKNSVSPYPGLEQQVLDLVCAHRMQDRIQLSSFNHASLLTALQLIRDRNLGVPCGALYSGILAEPWVYAARLGFQAIHPSYNNLLIPNLIRNCHAAGLTVNAWTIDKPEHQTMALKLNIDAIITNLPEQARLIRDRQE